MKKTISTLVLIMLLTLTAHAARLPEITASILRYEPTPAEQGNTVDVWIALNNAGTTAKKVLVKFVPEYPFRLPQGQPSEIDAGSVAQTESKVIKFTLFVDPNAPNGESTIKFQYAVDGGQWAQIEAPLTLQTQNAVILIDEYTVTPTPIIPGQTTDVTLKLRNAGRIAVKNVDASIDLADGTFSTIGSGALKRIDYIDAGETEELTFTLASDTSTEVKVYNIPITLAYQDERNKALSSTAKISLVVNAKPELSLTIDRTTFDTKTSPGTVSLKVVNKGIVNLKYVTVRLIHNGQYEILSPSNEAYVGNLDSDDFETADFTLKPLVDTPRLAVQLEFKDPYNVDFTQQYTLPLRIITAQELGQKKFPTGIVLVGLLIISAILYWWFKRKKKR